MIDCRSSQPWTKKLVSPSKSLYLPCSFLSPLPSVACGPSWSLLRSQKLILTRLMGTELVQFFVGPKRKAFSAHNDLECRKPAVLNRLLNSTEKPTDLYLAECALVPVQDFISLLYRDRKAIESRRRSLADCLGLYQFADEYDTLLRVPEWMTRCCTSIQYHRASSSTHHAPVAHETVVTVSSFFAISLRQGQPLTMSNQSCR